MPNKDYHACTDSDLLALLREDIRPAFDEIYARYWEKLFVYLLKVVEDKDDVKDLLQEIFVSLWHRRLDAGEISSLKAYLFVAARYKGFDYIKKNINKNRYLESLANFFEEEDHACDAQHAASELGGLIDREIDRLPEKMREVFILSRREDLSHKLISERLMISEKTVKKQINNVLKVLRLKLAEK